MLKVLLPFAIVTHAFQVLSVGLLVYTFIKRPHPVKYFLPVFLYVVAYFATDIASTLMAFLHNHNVWLSNIYYPSEYLILSWLYYITSPKHQRLLIYILGAAAMIVFAFTAIYFKGISGHNYLGMSFVHSALLIIAGRYLVWLTAKGQSELKSDPLFYISLGVILDSGITAISFILFDTFEYHLPFIINSISDMSTTIFAFIGVFFLFRNEMAVLNVLREAEKESSVTE